MKNWVDAAVHWQFELISNLPLLFKNFIGTIEPWAKFVIHLLGQGFEFIRLDLHVDKIPRLVNYSLFLDCLNLHTILSLHQVFLEFI